MKFSIKISSVNVTKPQETMDLVTSTAKILNKKLRLLCSATFHKLTNFINKTFNKQEKRI